MAINWGVIVVWRYLFITLGLAIQRAGCSASTRRHAVLSGVAIG